MTDPIERMGYVPCYKWPEKIDEDDQFEYFKIRIPRHYIRMHIEEGGIWHGYEETDEEGERDRSVVLGIIYLPAIPDQEPMDADADFLYYRIAVPKSFLDSYIMEGNVQYRVLYETKAFKLETPQEKAEREAAEFEEEKFVPPAGASMPGRNELDAVKRAKRTKMAIYEIELQCKNPDCGIIHVEVTSDLFSALSGRICGECMGTAFNLVKAEAIVREEEDD